MKKKKLNEKKRQKNTDGEKTTVETEEVDSEVERILREAEEAPEVVEPTETEPEIKENTEATPPDKSNEKTGEGSSADPPKL